MPSHTRVDEWLDWMRKVKRVSTGTLASYRSTMESLIGTLEEQDRVVDWSTLDATTIESWVVRPRRDGGERAAATMARDRACVNSFYTYLVLRGIARHNPVLDVPTVEVHNRNPRAIGDREWQQFWASDIPDEDRVWIGLGAFAGMRRQEIVQLAPSQVDIPRGLLLGVRRKGGAHSVIEFAEMAAILGERLPHFLPDVDGWVSMVDRLVRYRSGERVLITHDQPACRSDREWANLDDASTPSPRVINQQLNRLLVRAGMPNAFTPHALRHTCATNLLRCGVPVEVVSDCLGHSSPQMTMRYAQTAGRLGEFRRTGRG